MTTVNDILKEHVTLDIECIDRLRRELEEIDQTAQTLPRASIVNKDCICHLIENQALTS